MISPLLAFFASPKQRVQPPAGVDGERRLASHSKPLLQVVSDRESQAEDKPSDKDFSNFGQENACTLSALEKNIYILVLLSRKQQPKKN